MKAAKREGLCLLDVRAALTTGCIKQHIFNQMFFTFFELHDNIICIPRKSLTLHTRQVWPDDDEYVTVDFFRFHDDGKIIEQQDSIQKAPQKGMNKNTML